MEHYAFRIQVIQTDKGAEFQSDFHWHLERLDNRNTGLMLPIVMCKFVRPVTD